MANSRNQHRCVFVGNLPYHATEKEIIQKCQEIGPVVSFRLMTDKETGKPKGFGFCEYLDEETALSALRNLKGQEIRGRKLRVDFADNDKNSDKNRKKDNNQNQFGNDPLTQHLVKMSRDQLIEIVKELYTPNNEQAGELLLACPGLPKAIFKAQILLGILPPEMLHILNISQDFAAAPEFYTQNNISQGSAATTPEFYTQNTGLDHSQLAVRSEDFSQYQGNFDTDHPSKRVKLNDGRAISSSSADEEASISENRVTQAVQYSPEKESYILQQVMQLQQKFLHAY